MKGIVFTEFIEFVELKFGLKTANEIIEKADLPSGGAYTSVGTYDFSEMLQLITNLSNLTSISIDDLLLTYGEHFFSILSSNYPTLIQNYSNPIDLLASIEDHIHVEVLKIYPDAELPSFRVIEKKENSLILTYSSSRGLYNFGLGLMNKTFEHYNTTATILVEKIKEDGTEVKFSINQN